MTIYVGQTVTVTATVTANGTALSNATVTGSYSGPASGSLTFSQSSTAGVYTSSFTVGAAGTYTVTVTASETGYETGTATATFTAENPLTASLSASPTSGTAPLTVTFSVSMSGGTGSGYEWNVYFGDGSQSGATSSSVTHTYSSAGTYTAYAWAEDSSGNEVKSNEINISVSSPSGTISFTESGLPLYNVIDRKPSTPVNWSIVINGTTYSAAAGSDITVTVTGSVNFTVNDVSVLMNTARVTYHPSPSSGTASIGQTISISYST